MRQILMMVTHKIVRLRDPAAIIDSTAKHHCLVAVEAIYVAHWPAIYAVLAITQRYRDRFGDFLYRSKTTGISN